jgi:hypothetical protein
MLLVPLMAMTVPPSWSSAALSSFSPIANFDIVLDHEEPCPIRWKIRWSRICATHAAACAATISEIQVLLPHWQQSNTVVKSDDRGKREILEQIRASIIGLQSCL